MVQSRERIEPDLPQESTDRGSVWTGPDEDAQKGRCGVVPEVGPEKEENPFQERPENRLPEEDQDSQGVPKGKTGPEPSPPEIGFLCEGQILFILIEPRFLRGKDRYAIRSCGDSTFS